MTRASAKKAALAAVWRMSPLLRPGYRSNEFPILYVYAPYMPLIMTEDLVVPRLNTPENELYDAVMGRYRERIGMRN
jgi:hypothetical protein